MRAGLLLELLFEAAEASACRDQATDDHVLLEARSQSLLPSMAASVSTRVVSWKEAAEMKLSVLRDALVI